VQFLKSRQLWIAVDLQEMQLALLPLHSSLQFEAIEPAHPLRHCEEQSLHDIAGGGVGGNGAGGGGVGAGGGGEGDGGGGLKVTSMHWGGGHSRVHLGGEHSLLHSSEHFRRSKTMQRSQSWGSQAVVHEPSGALLHSSQLPVQFLLSLQFWIAVVLQELHLESMGSHVPLQFETVVASHWSKHSEKQYGQNIAGAGPGAGAGGGGVAAVGVGGNGCGGGGGVGAGGGGVGTAGGGGGARE